MKLFRSLAVIALLLTTPVVFAQDVAAPPSTPRTYISVGTSEDEVAIKATPGVLVSISAWNVNTSADAFLKCANATAGNTAPGTTVPNVHRMLIPFGSGHIDANINATFDTALTCWIVLGAADNSVAEVASNEVGFNLRYR